MSAAVRGNVRMAIAGVRGAKWRSLLTMLGIIVGIVAVVTIVGIGEGVKRQVAGQLGHFGKDLITIRPGSPETDKSLTSLAGTDVLFGMNSSTGLAIADVKVVQQTPEVKATAPLGVVAGAIEVDDQTFSSPLVIGTSANFPEVLNQNVKYGDFWTSDQETAPAAVIGRRAAHKLFSNAVPLGRSFTFHGQTFLVRGVLDSFDNGPLSPTSSFDDAVFIPHQTAANITKNNAGLYTILAKAQSADELPGAITAITAHLRHAHGDQQDFTVLSPEQNVANSSQVVSSLTVWITAVAAISLFIGGVGIMNIMLLSVSERMHEIGVRKAIGASRRQILSQFVLEASVLSVVGGFVGIVLSLIVVGLLYTYSDLKPVISWEALAIATGVSLAIGVVFGVIPAIKAASKDPIEALRHE